MSDLIRVIAAADGKVVAELPDHTPTWASLNGARDRIQNSYEPIPLAGRGEEESFFIAEASKPELFRKSLRRAPSPLPR